MTHPLRKLGRPALLALSEVLTTGRLGSPITRAALAPHVPEEHLDPVAATLVALERDGMAPRHIARAIDLLAEERSTGQRMSDRVELVFSPPAFDAVDARDTAVVVQELFRRARTSVLICTFALDEKKRAEALFGELAARMDAEPDLSVRVFANIHRRHQDKTASSVLIREFTTRIRDQLWPGKRLPELFYDPRSLEIEPAKRAVLHAKALVIDRRWSLLTSANLTEAAQDRNIEAGALLDDARIAERITRQFDHFIEARILRKLTP